MLGACAPAVETASDHLKTEVAASLDRKGFSEGLFELLTPASRKTLLVVPREDWVVEFLKDLQRIMQSARPVAQEPGLVQGESPSDSVFFVRDGYSWRMDLALSGAWFSAVRSLEYPRPW